MFHLEESYVPFDSLVLWLLFVRVSSFLSSDQYRCASKLLSAYTDGDIEEIKRVAQSSTISNLDHVVILKPFIDWV